MKTIQFLFLSLFLVGSSSCVINLQDTIYGSGDVITEDRSVSDFNKLKVSSGIDVIIKYGDSESLEIKADDNLIEHIKTEVEDGTLKIYTNKNLRKARSMTVYLEYKKLNSIRISSAGDVSGQNKMVTDKLKIDISSAGDLDLEVEAEEIICDISSSGDARLHGTAEYLEADLSSAGDLHAYELIVENCDVSCSSAGDARVYATEELDLRCSSAGNIYYKGEAELVSSHSSSAGSIVRK
jgi:hypothetical protein